MRNYSVLFFSPACLRQSLTLEPRPCNSVTLALNSWQSSLPLPPKCSDCRHIITPGFIDHFSVPELRQRAKEGRPDVQLDLVRVSNCNSEFGSLVIVLL